MRAPDQAPIFKRVVQWIGMTERFIDRVSGHSARVGATQDLAAPDIDLAAITLAGGGVEIDAAARSGVAGAAEESGGIDYGRSVA
jgi:hypothetical protein